MSSPSSYSLDAEKYEIKYCSRCDVYLHSKALLQQHMEASDRHPRCGPCKRSYLNMNSLRNHYVYSSKHHYCRACDKLFKTPSGLRVHLEQSAFHNDDSDDEGDDDGLAEGWEDEVARRQDEAERRNQTEEEIAIEEAEVKQLSSIQRRAAMMNFMARRMRSAAVTTTTHTNTYTPEVVQTPAHSYSCPVCLTCPKTVSATRCGHLFCNS
ncbi:hypothetical protein D9615_002085 [Tricholomella constricta]|uniref:C2H2-type domain-containing protein n=1 Tax=Tricholomella constricta TaxID=117010 RepID=A0A8H5HPN2_9AGAR|nr:hypothetical protein D9615_002085 [Tricholomella constricta]